MLETKSVKKRLLLSGERDGNGYKNYFMFTFKVQLKKKTVYRDLPDGRKVSQEVCIEEVKAAQDREAELCLS